MLYVDFFFFAVVGENPIRFYFLDACQKSETVTLDGFSQTATQPACLYTLMSLLGSVNHEMKMPKLKK